MSRPPNDRDTRDTRSLFLLRLKLRHTRGEARIRPKFLLVNRHKLFDVADSCFCVPSHDDDLASPRGGRKGVSSSEVNDHSIAPVDVFKLGARRVRAEIDF